MTTQTMSAEDLADLAAFNFAVNESERAYDSFLMEIDMLTKYHQVIAELLKEYTTAKMISA